MKFQSWTLYQYQTYRATCQHYVTMFNRENKSEGRLLHQLVIITQCGKWNQTGIYRANRLFPYQGNVNIKKLCDVKRVL